MSKSESITVHNPNNDFCLIQNYAIQLVSEGKLTPSAFVLYSFYQSLNGFSYISPGYRYISENTGICTGNIKKCNELLVECGLITVKNNGFKKPFMIELTPNHMIPRRVLKTVDCSEPETECSSDEQEHQKVNSQNQNCSSGEHIQRLQQDRVNTDITTTPRKKSRKNSVLDTKKQVEPKNILFTAEEHHFIKTFISRWKYNCKSNYYPKEDFSEIKKLKDIPDATKYIEVLWCLDEVDKWVKNSDHTLTVFVKEYLSGRLQAHFPKTIYAVETMPA